MYRLRMPLGLLLAISCFFIGCDSPLDGRQLSNQDEETSPVSTVIEKSGELANYDGFLSALAWSEDGTQLATTALLGESYQWEGVEVVVWNTDTMNMQASKEIEVLPRHLAVALSPDATKVAIASSDNEKATLDVLNTNTGEVIESSEPDIFPNSLAFSPNQNFLFTGANKIEVKSLGDVDPVQLNDQHKAPISAFSFSKDGKYVASGSGLFDIICGEGVDDISRGDVMVHDTTDGTRIVKLQDPDKPAFSLGIQALALSPDGTVLATANSGKLRLWDAVTGELKTRLNISEHKFGLYGKRVTDVHAIEFSPNGNRLAVGVGNEVDIWDVTSEEVIARLRWHQKMVVALAFSHDGNCLASAGGGVKIWDLRPRSDLLNVDVDPIHTLKGHSYWVGSVAFSPDGSQIVSGDYNGGLRFWDPVDGSVFSEHKRALRGLARDEIKDLSYLSDGELVVAGGMQSESGVAGTWDPETTSLKQVVETERQLDRVRVTPDGKTLIVVAFDRIGFVDRATGDEIGSISVRNGASPYALGLSPDGKVLVTGAPHVQFWEVETQKKIWEIESLYATALKFSPDGTTVAAGSDRGKIELWNFEQQQLIGQFQSHDSVQSMAYSPDGRLLASGATSTGRVRLWDTVIQQPIAAPWTNEVAVFDAHPRGHVLALEFSPDGKTLASGGSDRLVKLWSIGAEVQKEESD